LSLNNHKVHYNDFSSYAFLANIGVGDSILLKIKDTAHNNQRNYQVKAKQFRQKLINFSENTQFAIVRIDEYKDGMQAKLKQFLKKINNRKPLIIDLRYCPGGDLFAAVDMLSPFIGRSRSIAYLNKETSYQAVSLNTIATKPLFKRPIYILTSKFTASSAEVFIRGIKHAVKNSYTVGEATQGKCLAQESHALGDGSALLLSSYKILTPNKKSCEQIPIKADKKLRNIELLDMDAVMNFLE
jgi:carboxyl-terminal processing protease